MGKILDKSWYFHIRVPKSQALVPIPKPSFGIPSFSFIKMTNTCSQSSSFCSYMGFEKMLALKRVKDPVVFGCLNSKVLSGKWRGALVAPIYKTRVAGSISAGLFLTKSLL